MTDCPHTRWIVHDYGHFTRYLFVHCEACLVRGFVSDPTTEEFAKAFYAPDHPYTWDGGNGRVVVIEEKME